MVKDAAAQKIRAWKHRRQIKAGINEFYYNSLEVSARVGKSGTEWATIRKCTVTSMMENLRGVRIGYLPRNAINGVPKLLPVNLSLVPEEDSYSGFHHAVVTPAIPLKKNQRLDFEFSLDFTKPRPKVDRLSTIASARIDELVLRVVFDSLDYRGVGFKIHDVSNRVLHEGPCWLTQLVVRQGFKLMPRRGT